MRNIAILIFVLTVMSPAARGQDLLQQLPLRSAESSTVATLTISSNDVIQSSLLVFRRATNSVFVKFHYTEAGSNKVRTFYERHQRETARLRVGAFETPPFPVNHTNTTGRDGFWGLAEKDADAVLARLKTK